MERKDNSGFLSFIQKLFNISPYFDEVEVKMEDELEDDQLVENLFQSYDQVTIIEPDDTSDESQDSDKT